MTTEKNGGYKWIILVFLALINIVAFMQFMGTAVLLPVIGHELHFSIAQLGFIWGMWNFGGVFLCILGGLIGDRIGIRTSIFIATLIVAIASGLRGLAKEIVLMSTLQFIAGGVIGLVLSVGPKAMFMWFPISQFGLANGLVWAATAVGMALGAAITATIVAPAVGGWQNAFFLYGAILLVLSFVWLGVGREPAEAGPPVRVPFADGISKTIRIRDVWLCAIAYFGVMGLVVAFLGYLPLYLQHNMEWTVAAASTSVSAFTLLSIITSIFIPSLSDRFGLRKPFFVIPVFILLIAVGMVALFKATGVLWTLFAIAGLAYGGVVPILNSMMGEIKGVGAMYAGTAIGIGWTLAGLSGWVISTVNGQLAMNNVTLPFFFGPIVLLACMVPFFFIKETGTKSVLAK